MNNPVKNIDPDGMDVWSTTDPGEIRRAMESLLRGRSFRYNDNWTHTTDNEFLNLRGSYSAGLNYNSRTGQLWLLSGGGIGEAFVSQLTWVPGKGFIEHPVGRYELLRSYGYEYENSQAGEYDWGRAGKILGAGTIVYSALENAVANQYWWMDAKGNYHSTDILSKGANGKYIQGVQGYRNGYNSALNAASKFKIAGNIVGGLGVGVTFVQWRSNQITALEAGIDTAFGIISFMGPVGAGIGGIYFIGKSGYEYFSGNTLFEKPR